MLIVVNILFFSVAIVLLMYNCGFLKSSEGRWRCLIHIIVGITAVSALYKLSVVFAYDLLQTIFYNERIVETNRHAQITALALVLLVITTFFTGVYHIRRVNDLFYDDNRKDKIIYVVEMIIRIRGTFGAIVSIIGHFDVSSLDEFTLPSLLFLFGLKWIFFVPVITRVSKYLFDKVFVRIRGI